jgi:hypothetical protein
MKRGAVVMVAVLAVGLSGCGASSSSGTPDTSASADVIERTDALGPGSWMGARTTADGGLRIVLSAGPEFRAGDPCTADYTGSAEETDNEVRVTIIARSPKPPAEYGCNAKGYGRLVDVTLNEPLGDRALVFEPAGTTQAVFDGSAMLAPSTLPDGWVALSEASWAPDPNLGQGWTQAWGEPPRDPTGNACTPGVAPVSLVQGPSDIISFFATKGQPAGEFQVRGHQATYLTGGLAADSALIWTEGVSGYALITGAGCAGDTQVAVDQLVQVANSLK